MRRTCEHHNLFLFLERNAIQYVLFYYYYFYFLAGLLGLLSLLRKAIDCGFRVDDVLSFLLSTRETCCPGELHFTLALFTLYKLSLSLTFGQIYSRTQLLEVVKFPSRGATLSKESILL